MAFIQANRIYYVALEGNDRIGHDFGRGTKTATTQNLANGYQ